MFGRSMMTGKVGGYFMKRQDSKAKTKFFSCRQGLSLETFNELLGAGGVDCP